MSVSQLKDSFEADITCMLSRLTSLHASTPHALVASSYIFPSMDKTLTNWHMQISMEKAVSKWAGLRKFY